MVTGYPEADHKGFNTFSKAREWLSTRGHKQFYFCQGPSDGDKSVVDEHGGHPGFYVATDGQNAAIFENYRYCRFRFYSFIPSLPFLTQLTGITVR